MSTHREFPLLLLKPLWLQRGCPPCPLTLSIACFHSPVQDSSPTDLSKDLSPVGERDVGVHKGPLTALVRAVLLLFHTLWHLCSRV